MRVTISGDLPDLADTTSIVYEQVEARAAEQDFGEAVVPVQYVGPVILGFDENAIELPGLAVEPLEVTLGSHKGST